MKIERNPTRPVWVRDLQIGGGAPISYQSMTATRTQDVEATVALTTALAAAGADLVRIAIDSRKDLEALIQVRERTTARLVVDLQENYPLAEMWLRMWTRFGTTRGTCIISSATNRSRTRCRLWRTSPRRTTALCASG